MMFHRWGSFAHIADFLCAARPLCVTLGIVTLRAAEGDATMADTTVAEDRQDERHELDTRDSLAAMARRKSARNSADAEHQPQHDAAQSQEQQHASDATTTQVLPPSFIPTATGRIRPVTGAFPAIQSVSQTEQAHRRRSIQSLAAGSLRRNAAGTEGAADADDSPTPRIASSAPHYVN